MAVLDQTQEEIKEIEVEEEDLRKAGEQVYVAPPWKLMWWRFRKHKMAMVSAVVLIVMYFVAIFCEFVAPYEPDNALLQFKQVPPSSIHIRDTEGQFHFPFVYGRKRTMDLQTLAITVVEVTTTRYPIELFVHGFKYKLFGLWETDIHLYGVPSGQDTKASF